MKFFILFSSVLLFRFSNVIESPSDFDYKISDIARKFKEEIMNKDECEKQKREAHDLTERIEDAIKTENEYSSEEINTLKKLKKEAESLEDYIAEVGNCGNYIPTIENITIANRRVGGSISCIIKDKYCVDIISVTIGNYIAYIGENNSKKNYTVSYKWKAPIGMNTGSGTMGLTKGCVRNIYNNRERQNQKNITVYGISCIEF